MVHVYVIFRDLFSLNMYPESQRSLLFPTNTNNSASCRTEYSYVLPSNCPSDCTEVERSYVAGPPSYPTRTIGRVRSFKQETTNNPAWRGSHSATVRYWGGSAPNVNLVPQAVGSTHHIRRVRCRQREVFTFVNTSQVQTYIGQGAGSGGSKVKCRHGQRDQRARL